MNGCAVSIGFVSSSRKSRSPSKGGTGDSLVYLEETKVVLEGLWNHVFAIVTASAVPVLTTNTTNRF